MHSIYRGVITLVAVILSVGILATAVGATDALPAISGMALIEGRDFFVVVDTKADSDDVRCGVVSVGEAGGYTFTPLTVAWPGERSNDLESASPIPGRPGEFLAAESGGWADWNTGAKHEGRIFHLKLTHEAGTWQVQVLNTLPLDPKLKEVEGMACKLETRSPAEIANAGAYIAGHYAGPELFTPEVPKLEEPAAPSADDGAAAATPAQQQPPRWQVFLGTRGAGVAYEPARLYSGYADLDAGKWTSGDLTGNDVDVYSNYYQPANPWLRGITDMYLDPSGMLWIARAVDPGDGGPFTSYIVRYTKIGGEMDYGPYGPSGGEAGWTICGCKVEALAAPVIAGSVLSFASDDESYGGIWRPLGPP